jgi:hypothetical protein
MSIRPRILVASVALAAVTVAAAAAQEKPAPAPATDRKTPLRVQVVVSRFEGEKKVASAPYTLTVAASEHAGRTELARLRIGTEVPVTMAATPQQGDAKAAGAFSSIQYRPVGTNIDCNVRRVDESSFEIQLTIEQSSVLEGEQQKTAQSARTAGAPMFRSFRFVNSAVLRDGQTTQFTNAADALTGEIVRIDVTLNIVK